MTVVVLVLALLLVVVGVAAIRARRRVDALHLALSRLSDALAAGADREVLLAAVLDAARGLTAAHTAVLWADVGGTVVARMVRGRQTISVGDRRLRAELRGVVLVPLTVRNREYGVIALYGADLAWHGDVIALARQAELALDATYDHEEARRLSITDGLTGLWNRRQFDIRCVEELDRAARFGERFAVVLCDLDDFKAINDNHGHLIGDAVLVEAASRLVEHTRDVDFVARYGGEEFGLVLPRTELPGAMKVAENARALLSAEPIVTDAGPLQLTVSVGVACHPEHGETIPALLAAADAALYEAKQAGKNRVYSAHRDRENP